MLDLPALIATLLLLFYAVYAAARLVPREHPLEAIVINVLTVLVGLIGVSPWTDLLPNAAWPAQLLVIALATVVTVWRHEAATFVRCRWGHEDPNHPMRRSSDFAQFDETNYPHVNGHS